LVSSVSHLLLGDIRGRLGHVQDQPRPPRIRQFNASSQNTRLTLFVMNAGGRLVRQIRVAAKAREQHLTLRGVNLLLGDTHCDSP